MPFQVAIPQRFTMLLYLYCLVMISIESLSPAYVAIDLAVSDSCIIVACSSTEEAARACTDAIAYGLRAKVENNRLILRY